MAKGSAGSTLASDKARDEVLELRRRRAAEGLPVHAPDTVNAFVDGVEGQSRVVVKSVKGRVFVSVVIPATGGTEIEAELDATGANHLSGLLKSAYVSAT